MIKTNDGNVKLEGTGLEILGDLGVSVIAIAKLLMEDFGISEEYTRKKLHEVLDISIDSIKNEGDAANDFS